MSHFMKIRIYLLIVIASVSFVAAQYAKHAEQNDEQIEQAYEAGVKAADDEAFNAYVHFAKQMQHARHEIQGEAKADNVFAKAGF